MIVGNVSCCILIVPNPICTSGTAGGGGGGNQMSSCHSRLFPSSQSTFHKQQSFQCNIQCMSNILYGIRMSYNNVKYSKYI